MQLKICLISGQERFFRHKNAGRSQKRKKIIPSVYIKMQILHMPQSQIKTQQLSEEKLPEKLPSCCGTQAAMLRHQLGPALFGQMLRPLPKLLTFEWPMAKYAQKRLEAHPKGNSGYGIMYYFYFLLHTFLHFPCFSPKHHSQGRTQKNQVWILK